MDDIFFYIKNSSEEIIELLEENRKLYIKYFNPNRQGLNQSVRVRDLLLPDEEELFFWDRHYLKWLKKCFNDNKRLIIDPIGYYQKLYEIIIIDMSYGDVYDNLHIVD